LLTTGTKYFLGLCAAAVVGLLLYGIGNNWGAMGTIGITSVMVAAGFMVAITSYTRDSTVSGLDTEALKTSAAAQAPAQRSVWPFAAAVGVTLMALGSVTYSPVFVAGVVVLLYTMLAWMVTAWSEHASGSDEYNEEARERMLGPAEYPLAGALLVGVLAFSLSRVMLGVDPKAGAAIFGGTAALVLIAGWAFSHKAPRKVVAGVVAAAVVLVVGSGVAMGVNGQRGELTQAETEDHFAAEHRDCNSPEEQEFDEAAPNKVAAKASVFASVTLEDGQLHAREVSTHEDTDTLTLSRSAVSNILFTNEDSEPRRLTIELGTEPIEGATDGATRPVRVCTALVGEGQTQLLTVRPAKPSFAFPDQPFSLYVPGVEGAQIHVEVL